MITSSYIVKYPIVAKAFNFVNLNGKGNYNPYHNFNHVSTVFFFVSRFLQFIESDKERELLIAAIFHDYNHSAGKYKNDTANIYMACDGVKRFQAENALGSYTKDIDFTFIIDLIFATRFPYDIPDDKLTKEGHLLRDADLAYLFSPIAIPMTLGGLRTELDLDLKSFLDSQPDFINSLKFRIPEVQKLWSNVKQDRLNEIKALRDVL